MANIAKSILPPEFRGVFYITGEKGMGKTTLSVQIENPALVVFWDNEDKGEGFHEQLHFSSYRPLTRLAAQKYSAQYDHAQYYELLRQEVAALRGTEATVLVIDNIEPLENALAAAVKTSPEKYGVKSANAISGSYGGVYPGVNHLIGGLCTAIHSCGIKLIVPVAHTKPAWGSRGPIPNKVRAKGTERWQELSILSLALLPGDYRPVPSALVLKEQLGRVVFDENTSEFEITRRLPLRLPRATMKEIYHYLKHPANLGQPQDDEIPTEAEWGLYSEKFTRAQLDFMIKELDAGAVAIADESGSQATLSNLIIQYTVERVLSANNGRLPASAEEIAITAQRLRGEV